MKTAPFPSRFQPVAAAALLGLSLFVSGANAATIVDWGGDYVAADTPLSTGTTHASPDGKTLTYRYSATVPKSPGFTAPEGRSGTFYGAFETSHSGASDARFDAYGILQNAGGDRIQITGRGGEAPPSGSANHATGLIFFKKEDFLSGADAGSVVTLNAESSLTLAIRNVPTATRRFRAAVYALVDEEWNWYLSSAVYTAGATTTTLDLGTLSTTWALWEIDESLTAFNPAPDSGSYTVSGTTLREIAAAGVYFSIEITSTTAPGVQLGGITFNAHVAAIPEPGACALLLLTGAGMLLCGLRKRNASV
ncbi:MAG TPA: hypothetical protein VNQ90_11935 [Chthoniobacteraceae bacterium]|nr:hypothetical protein [Chthoniobacteraceae bacterium]